MMSTGFARERITTALATFRAFWLGESTEPLVSVYAEPVYRQVADPEQMVDLAVQTIRVDGAGGETEILPSFLPDFGTITTARMWGGRASGSPRA